MKTFSVIIPTCHRNDLLALCLERLAPGAQTLDFDSYEVIVTDDGSHATAEQMIAQRFPWARWVRGLRRGPAANRNNGARAAGGAWIVFTDDDCLPDRGWLEAFDAATKTSAVQVLEGRTYTETNSRGLFWTAPVNETGGLLWSCNMAVRRELFFSLGQFDEKFPYPHLEDVDFRERLKSAGQPFVFRPDAGVFHPLRPVGSATRQVLVYESYFYYARKHGLSLKQSGLSVRILVSSHVKLALSARNVSDFGRLLWRMAIKTVVLVVLCPWWLLKFRSVAASPS
jgi:GT2 family glycosyltransferase